MRAASTIIGALLLAACGGAAPQELLDARAAQARAAQGPAVEFNPAGLHVAETALAIAEKTYENDGNCDKTRDRSYVAIRKVERAEVTARIRRFVAAASESERESRVKRSQMNVRTRTELAEITAQVVTRGREVDVERRRREEAEHGARTLLLLEGIVFPSGLSDLSVADQSKLADVVRALKDTMPTTTVIVEGHTDSHEALSASQELSRLRAEAVRDYLISHGLAPDRITAQGLGSTRPLVDGTSEEQHMKNRRVEVVVSPIAVP